MRIKRIFIIYVYKMEEQIQENDSRDIKIIKSLGSLKREQMAGVAMLKESVLLNIGVGLPQCERKKLVCMLSRRITIAFTNLRAYNLILQSIRTSCELELEIGENLDEFEEVSSDVKAFLGRLLRKH